MFAYTVAKEANDKVFLETCRLIETKIKQITKEKPLVDVDGSTHQTYQTPNGTIKVSNDYYTDATYVESSVNLDNLIVSVV